MSVPTDNLTRAAKDPAWAWARYEPVDGRGWNVGLAAHLLARAGFGSSLAERGRAVADGPQKTIDRLVHPPEDVNAFEQTYAEYERASEGSIDALRAWWLRRMVETPFPLLEKLTLFWHGHFAVSQNEVGRSPLMQRHVQLLREHALGPFRSLLQAVMVDPAMLLCLEAQKSRKATPPLMLARTLLGAFTVGEGNYTDRDVAETARAFTGWFVLRTRLQFYDREFDDGDKEILGKKDNFTTESALDRIADQRATSRTVVRKLYRQFVSETDDPGDELLDPLVDSLAAGGDVLATVETMLRSNLFFSPLAPHSRVKSPVEFALGLARCFTDRIATQNLGPSLAGLGQDLYNPPTSAGWPGGLDWLNDASIVGRHRLAAEMLAPDGKSLCNLNVQSFAAAHDKTDPAASLPFFTDLLLPGSDAAVEMASIPKRLEDLVLAIACLPDYQLT